ncbi:TlpA family protein disulfide reductase [Halopiger xanaduensis]|uniref:Alkyl hydroperoxide reductase/ Thiol specific antioxidant/ Mal allergen n=1 Tax=Halopiger xanaduensis (strain DSM 18323 / JCM 14033 / SH-6) TaxID=797210 RepID=F8D5X8_HALXS|nr:TlpA disulfide reductase family protein [Halopiger xanaduensis]AEH37704.1 alkyl hydroperoxide reductase/ Thiol specific antioxidant/ Mal allergen [Halopiger xanaduensis SH-6]
MRRRDVLTGLGSAGVLAGAGAVAVYGLPSVDELTGEAESDEDEPRDPLELETVDAPGSEAGETLVPEPGRPTFIDLFATWCSPCEKQMPALAEAHEQVADADVQFVSVTNEGISHDELAAWWDEHDGSWPIAVDPAAEVSARYLESGYPTAVTIDASGQVLWADDGVKSTDELVDRIETAIDASAEGADG